MKSEETIIYREATQLDLNQLKNLGIASYKQYKDTLTLENWETLNTFLNDEALLSELINMANVFVCSIEDEIIGMIFIIPSGNQWEIFQQDWSYIRMLGVHPEYRGLGIAAKLVDMCIKSAISNKEDIIALHTGDFMQSAIQLYEKAGFMRYKSIPNRLGREYYLYLLDIKKQSRY